MRRLLALSLLTAAVLTGAATLPAAHADGDHSTRVLVLVDASMSEPTRGGATGIEATRRALAAAAADLGPREEVGLALYGTREASACDRARLLVEPRPGSQDELAAALERPAAATDGDALDVAGEALGDKGPRAVVLVAHRAPACASDPVEAAARLTAADPDLRVHVVGVDAGGADRRALMRLADAGDGVYRDAQGVAGVRDAVGSALTRATQVYLGGGIPAPGGGAAETATAVRSGTWFDTLAARGSEHDEGWFVFQRVLASSTLHLHAAMRLPAGPDEAGAEVGLEVAAYAGEQGCGTARGTGTTGADALVSVYLPVPELVDGADACRDARRVAFVVRRSDDGDVPALPVEMYAAEEAPAPGAPLTPVAKDAAAPRPSLASPGPAQTGAPTFSQAPQLAGGAHRGVIVPGETQVFRVPVGWGQRLGAAVRFPAGVRATVQVISPNRAPVVEAATAADGTARVVARTVGYGNRAATDPALAATNVAGDYALVVSSHAPEATARIDTPFVLSVDVAGAEQERPAYRGVLVSTDTSSTGPEAGEQQERGGLPAWGIAGLAALFGLVAGAVAWFASRRS